MTTIAGRDERLVELFHEVFHKKNRSPEVVDELREMCKHALGSCSTAIRDWQKKIDALFDGAIQDQIASDIVGFNRWSNLYGAFSNALGAGFGKDGLTQLYDRFARERHDLNAKMMGLVFAVSSGETDVADHRKDVAKGISEFDRLAEAQKVVPNENLYKFMDVMESKSSVEWRDAITQLKDCEGGSKSFITNGRRKS